MIFLLMLALALALLLPVALACRRGSPQRGARETALRIHRARLAELENDLKEGRIDDGAHAGARLEIERRLLAADRLPEPSAAENAWPLLATTLVLVPVMAFLLYLPGSTPDIPSEPHAQWLRERQNAHEQATILIADLRAKLATLDPASAEASQGQAYLGEALAEDAGALTPESIALFRQSIADAPAGATWRRLDAARLAEAAAQ